EPELALVAEPTPITEAAPVGEATPANERTLMDDLATDDAPTHAASESTEPLIEPAATTAPPPNGPRIAEPPAPNPYPFPQPDPLPAGRSLGRFLRRFAGVDEELMAWVPQERVRYSGMGGAVLFTGVMAFLSMTVALSLAFSTRSPL